MSKASALRASALLIYPPVHDFALYDLFLKPYGLLRLGRMLEAGGWSCRFINALDYKDEETLRVRGTVKRRDSGTGKFHRELIELPESLRGIKRRFARYGISPELLKAKVAESRPDAVFIATGMTYWYRGAVEAAETVKECWPGVPLILGGVYASLMPEHCAAVCGPDFICTGNGGIQGRNGAGIADSADGAGRSSGCTSGTLQDLALWLRNRGLPGLPGLPGLTADGGYDGGCGAAGPVQPLVRDCWSDAAVIRLNEGCPLNCDYCASKKISPCFIPGRPDDVFDWLIEVHERYGTRNFAFYDDALLFNSDAVLKPFLRRVIDYSERKGAGFNFYTPNAMHIRYMDAETARLMKAAGFREIRLGFESESEDFHDAHDRKYSSGSFHEVISMLTEAGFSREQIIVYILAGLPGQSAEEVEQTIRFAASKGLTLSVSEFSTVPGSKLWDECVAKSRYPVAEEPLFHNNSFFPMEWDGFTRDDMQRLKRLSKEL